MDFSYRAIWVNLVLQILALNQGAKLTLPWLRSAFSLVETVVEVMVQAVLLPYGVCLEVGLGFSAAFEGCVYVESFKSEVYVSSRSILCCVLRSEISAVYAGE